MKKLIEKIIIGITGKYPAGVSFFYGIFAKISEVISVWNAVEISEATSWGIPDLIYRGIHGRVFYGFTRVNHGGILERSHGWILDGIYINIVERRAGKIVVGTPGGILLGFMEKILN